MAENHISRLQKKGAEHNDDGGETKTLHTLNPDDNLHLGPAKKRDEAP